jgi:hypothetical protein
MKTSATVSKPSREAEWRVPDRAAGVSAADLTRLMMAAAPEHMVHLMV